MSQFIDAGVWKNSLLDRWEFSLDSNGSKTSIEPLDNTAGVTSPPILAGDGVIGQEGRKKKKTQKRRVAAARRSVQWGQVSEILFSRDIACMSIPNEGGYPLGLGEKMDVFCYPVASLRLPEIATMTGCVALSEKERISLLSGSSNKQEAAAVNREVKAIQRSRENVGCSCKPVRPDKLNIARLREEIERRQPGIMLPVLKRQDLLGRLRDLLQGESLCGEQEKEGGPCECVIYGLPCHPQHCHCQCRSPPSSPALSGGIVHTGGCGNPNVDTSFDPDRVQGHRAQVLSALKQSKSSFLSFATCKQ